MTNTPATDIIAKPGRYYRNARYLIFLLFFGWGVWSIYDGFYQWPRENEAARKVGQTEPHVGYDIPLNRALGIGLPPIAIAVIVWAHYRSRGQYHLANNILHVPSHPPVPLSAITKVDKTRFDRKGIVIVNYELATGRSGTFALDDFLYQQDPTDEIIKRIEEYLQPHEAA